MRLAAWRIVNGSPVRVDAANLQLEQQLEEWIESDPALAVEGLRVVGRQIVLEGGRLDLLGIDPQGQWVLVEIKRGKLYRDTLAQALDYAATIATMPSDKLAEIIGTYLSKRGESLQGHPAEGALALSPDGAQPRDVQVAVVGTGRDPSLDRLVNYLGTAYGVPIRVVTFEVFDLGDERQMLVREVTEADTPSETPAAHGYSLDAVFALAEQWGAGDRFRVLYDGAERNGLYARPFKQSIMYTSPSNKTRLLFTVWAVNDKGEVHLYLSSETFADFYPIEAAEVQDLLGPDGNRLLSTKDEALHFVSSLDSLFAAINAKSDGG
jgi:Endonuclease NucS C-terminal domain